MNLVSVKVVVLVFLGLIKLVSGLAPLLLVRFLKRNGMKWMENFMAGLMCFGGGVLLATVFIHMLPEVRDSLNLVLKDEENPEDSLYPFGELVLCAGFFTIYFIEALVHRIFNIHNHTHGLPTGADESHGHSHSQNGHAHNQNGHAHNQNGHAHHDHIEENGNTKVESSFMGQTNPTFISDLETLENGINSHRSSSRSLSNGLSSHPDSITGDKKPFGTGKYQFSLPDPKDGEKHVYNVSTATLTSYVSYGDLDDLRHLKATSPPSEDGNTQKRAWSAKEKEKRLMSSIRSFIIVLALSIHSIFEGMAIGLQQDADDVWKLFAAVAIHECAILFCVGNEMVSNGIKKCQIFSYMITLGLVTPIGITIGIVLTLSSDSQSDSQTLVVGILQGLAAGTLLYITFFEVLERDKLEKVGMTGLLGTVIIIAGFSLMAGLEATNGHSHNFDGPDNSTSTISPSEFGGSHHGHSHSHGHDHKH